MVGFSVKTERLHDCAGRISSVGAQLENIVDVLDGIDLRSVLRVRASARLIAQLNNCKMDAERCCDALLSSGNGLEAISALYEICERGLTTPSTGQTTSSGQSEEPGLLDLILDNTSMGIDWLLDRLREGSGAFATLSMLFNYSEGDILHGSMALLQIGSSFFGAFADVSTGADWFESFMGFNSTGIDDLSDAGEQLLRDLGIGGDHNSAAGTAASVCRWAGYALTFVESGLDNYAEFDGDLSNARFWGETIIEGVVDVGVGIGAGMLAAAVLPATWPAIAVGAVGSLAVWGADAIVGVFTNGESDLSDFVANQICDAVSETIDTVQDIGRSVVDGANAFCEWVGSWW